MAKKSSIGLFLIGMVVVLVGAFLPLASHSTFGLNGTNAIDAITNGSGDLKIAAILAVVGALCGVIFSFVKVKGVPVKLISLIVSLAGGIYMALSYLNMNPMAKKLGKVLGSISGAKPGLGIILIAAGWIIAIVGYIQSKEN